MAVHPFFKRMIAIEHCSAADKHEPHIHEPFEREPGMPNFMCGGVPRKIIDFEEEKLKRRGRRSTE